jgi:hypothetical protein
MATKADFTEVEWDQLHKGVTGSGMLVALSDRDFTDMFGEAGAMGKFLAGQRVAGATELMRELASAGGSGFGLTSSPDRVRAETIAALTSSVATLTAKAPDELGPYRDFVLAVASTVAAAKGGGEAPVETAMIGEIKAALGAA